jgi:hypothetical protein
VAIGYAIALNLWHPSLKSVLQLLGGFTCLLFFVCAVFTWIIPKPNSIQAAR